MATKFNTPELQEAYNTGLQIGRTEGMLICIQNTIKNLKLQYEKIYQKKLELEKSQEK